MTGQINVETTVTTVVTRTISIDLVERILCEHFKVDPDDTRVAFDDDRITEVTLTTTTRSVQP